MGQIERTLTNEQVATLNAARDVLDALREVAYMGGDTTSDGIVSEAASVASQAIFRTINVVNAYWGAGIHDGALHNRKVSA